MFLTYGIYLTYYFLCPVQSLLWVFLVWFIPCVVWSFSNYLALNRMFLLKRQPRQVVKLYAHCTFGHPQCLDAPMSECPLTSVCLHAPLYIYMFFPHDMRKGGHLYTPYVWGLLCISTFVRNFDVCQDIHCLSVHNSHASCSLSL